MAATSAVEEERARRVTRQAPGARRLREWPLFGGLQEYLSDQREERRRNKEMRLEMGAEGIEKGE
ncbi:MAG: hypothetical protein WCT32_02895 [Patescibacteria group bacterium]|jgi:hypothetical protein